MKCADCGHNMEKGETTYKYDESGLKNVLLMNIPQYKCPSCGETEIEIPCMEELHLLLGLLVVYQPEKLQAEKVKYLRKHMGFLQEELASYLGVTRITVTRWESGSTIRIDQDKALRQLYVRKKMDELQKLGVNVSRLLEVVLERLPLSGKKEPMRIRTGDWTKASAQSAFSY
ncbi:MAG: YgiT-type zinc finger protein [Nitrospira sp.]|nr:YgiT-type zinc finger protein [Nitrospira sp.]